MFKIHLLRNKDALIAASVIVALFLLLCVNLMTLIPTLLEVYAQNKQAVSGSPIDVETVDSAIDLLNGGPERN